MHGFANLCNTSIARGRRAQELASKSIVNFRYSGDYMHIALNARVADGALRNAITIVGLVVICALKTGF